MNSKGNDIRPGESEEADDRQIRRAAAAWQPAGAPVEIRTQVFSRIDRRRRMLWASLSALAATALFGAGLFWQMQTADDGSFAANSGENRFPPVIEVVSIQGVELKLLNEQSPVAEFEVVAQNQHDLVELLKSLEEEL